MNSYLQIAQKHLSVHKRKTRLTILSVIMAVALVVGIFSMLDALVRFERTQILKSEGNYHILLRNPTRQEIDSIANRVDVKNSGMLCDLGEGTINNEKCALGSIDTKFAHNLNIKLAEGNAPIDANEIVIEKWYVNKHALKIGDTVTVNLSNGTIDKYIICGTIKDWGATKAAAMPFVFLSQAAAEGQTTVSSQYFVLFKDGVNVQVAKDEIAAALNIQGYRFGYNEGLLALMIQTSNNKVLKFYAIGVVLFALVLITAVIMIYNTFNISVMERVRQFGLLRCIGASKVQIKRLVQRESLIISLKAIPLGILAGMLMTFACSAVLKYYNSIIFGDISIFNISIIGIGAGILIGFFSVFMASLIPAKKAARVSPVNAVTGNYDIKHSSKKKQGLLTRVFTIEIAIGVNNALNKKRTLILMSSSIAISIVLFLAFSVLVNPAFIGTNTTKSYTADISLTSDNGIRGNLFMSLFNLNGAKNVYGRMSSLVNATFDASRLTDVYKKSAGDIKVGADNQIKNPENSWLLSYDSKQLKWAKEYLKEGTCNEKELNENNGIIAVGSIYRSNKLTKTTDLQLGDKVNIQAGNGTNEFKVMGIMDSVPYSTEALTMTTFITTEGLFREVSEDTLYKAVDIQLNNKNPKQTVDEIKALLNETVMLHDNRQFNTEADNAYMTIAIFIYGFIGVIALISLLNIINTMNTSVASKIKYLGILRAIGMSGRQLDKMVVTQSVTYSLTGCIVGSICGILLQMELLNFLAAEWTFPLWQILSVFLFCAVTSVLSVIGPLSRIKSRGISETITTL